MSNCFNVLKLILIAAGARKFGDFQVLFDCVDEHKMKYALNVISWDIPSKDLHDFDPFLKN